MPEDQQRGADAHVEKLWAILDTRKEGAIDLNGLKKGLKKMDHPLKNADSLLHDVMKAVDTSGDGRIQYEEFRNFVQETEKELRSLFNSIDRDHNGNLDKAELQSAFSRAGLTVSSSKLDQFFEEVDTNHDGVISFDEWRDFLLFIPVNTPGLKAVLSYYSATVTVNPEGDVAMSGDSVQGLGTTTNTFPTPKAFPTTFLEAIASIASPRTGTVRRRKASFDPAIPPSPVRPPHMDLDPSKAPWPAKPPDSKFLGASDSVDILDDSIEVKPLLIRLMPEPGYFLAGGISGVVSRTATAPLDRLKVYLIAQTGTSDIAVKAAKDGAPVKAAKHASRPLVEATKQLWRAGGIRSLFAGNGLNVIKVMPESAIKFGSYEGSKRILAKIEGHGDPNRINSISKFFAGGMGGIISQFCVYPLDTLKFRMQSETVEGGMHGNALIKQTFTKAWQQNGFRGFYRGLPMGLVGMFPYSAIDLGTFEYLKRAIARRKAKAQGCHEDDAAPGSFVTAGIGAFSGAFGASIVYPLNLLRTRLQVQGTAQHPPTYTGIWDVTSQTIKREGFRGLFKGITPNLLKVVPAVSITYVVYENSKKALHLR